MNTLRQIIGNNIRNKRKILNIKQDELALLAEIDRSYMGRIERGEVNLTVDKLFQIALILKCEAAELLPNHEQLT
ncbi:MULTISPECIES: helix-turn-helix domain-containing protein [Neisseriaceae]|uniref:helix-turn-helix domain-containing protein n=1 Tax=Neisseriaceae TaxID=481 RepID=UPI00254FA437|nr:MULTISPECIES: helix-turn-helix transcriptional regulator [Neisseriaceae]MDK4537044.1 helix-turn-helix transcriptional regulator [Kingella kingae]MDK4539180.1 helix-turn-helix transcriptional regulator [Kingella kingae]MDK4546791.1 helix-turn-helix transcriptional regulator [Kingella kingae]MDK4622568.1 helix-turn-helix transcriptional regulator [Kingella kingae]